MVVFFYLSFSLIGGGEFFLRIRGLFLLFLQVKTASFVATKNGLKNQSVFLIVFNIGGLFPFRSSLASFLYCPGVLPVHFLNTL